jgi:hypothetical protein
MSPSYEARLGIRLLLALQLLTSLAAVLLLARMTPAVGRILRENVFSTEAVESMLGGLVQGDDTKLRLGLERARGNITEPAETEILDTIDRLTPAARTGDPGARAGIVQALHSLGDVNRRSMDRADQAATRLGRAGAWAVAMLGFVGFLGSLAVTRRLEQQLLEPLRELDHAVRSVREGDRFRRVGAAGEEPWPLVENINWLLAQRSTRRPERDAEAHRALGGLLDAFVPGKAVLLGEHGQVLAATAALLEAGMRPTDLAKDEVPDGFTRTELSSGLTLVAAGEG